MPAPDDRLIQLARRPKRPLDAPAAAPVPVRPRDFGLLVRDIEALESIVSGWDEQQKNTVRALESALDALHKEAFTRLIRRLKAEPAAAFALKQAVSDEVVYGVLRHHDILRASLHERIEAALVSVRPFLQSHGGNVELVEVAAPDAVTIRLLGSCDGCAASGLTLSAGVEKAIYEHCPEIKRIHQAKGALSAKPATSSGVQYVSPFARADAAHWVLATTLAELAESDLTVLEVAGHSVLFFRLGEKVSCFENACAHLGMPLDMGEVEGGVLTCPHHEFRYDLETGECLNAPGVQLLSHAVRVAAGTVEVRFS